MFESKVFYQYTVIIPDDMNFYYDHAHDSVSKCTAKIALDTSLLILKPPYFLRYEPVIQTRTQATKNQIIA